MFGQSLMEKAGLEKPKRPGQGRRTNPVSVLKQTTHPDRVGRSVSVQIKPELTARHPSTMPPTAG